MTVREIMVVWLREHGYDGLCHYECGCKVDDLMPCMDGGQDCEPGHMVACDCEGECDGERWHVQAGDVVSPRHPALKTEEECWTG